MVKISDQSDIAYTSITSPADVHLPVADNQSATPGTAYKVDVEAISRVARSEIITETAHGLVAGDQGKPLSGPDTVFDDTNSSHYPSWVLDQVIDVNTIRVVTSGKITFADTLMEAGYSIAVDGRYVYWDASGTEYVAAKPADTLPAFREILYIQDVSGGTVTAYVLNWGPPGSAQESTINVDTVSDLSTLSVSDDNLIQTRGYTSVGDGGDNLYRYDSGSSATIDGGFVIDGPGGSGRYLAVDQDVANVKKFGAAGDGVSDDQSKIQAAFDAAAPSGKVVLPVAPYLCNTGLSINSNIRVEGLGGRPTENDQSQAARLKWGGTTGTLLTINDNTDTGSTAKHGWSIDNLALDCASQSASVALEIGPGTTTGNKATVGSLRNLFIMKAGVGINCKNAQLNEWSHVHVWNCTTGVYFPYHADNGNTTVTANSLRVSSCQQGLNIEHLTDSQFIGFVAEQCTQEGVIIDAVNAGCRIRNLCFYNPHLEGNWTDPTTGNTQFKVLATVSPTLRLGVFLDHPRFGTTKTSDYDISISGGDFEIRNPYHEKGGEIDKSAATTTFKIDTFHDPLGSKGWTLSSTGSQECRGVVEWVEQATTPIVHRYMLQAIAAGFFEVFQQKKGFSIFSDVQADASTKGQRICSAHYTNSQEPLLGMQMTSGNGLGYVNIGGGTSTCNAATRIRMHTAANSTTQTGNVVAEWDDDQFTRTSSVVDTVVTFTDQDATPSVAGAFLCVTANTLATAITDFDGGVDGQTIELVINDANTTVTHNASLIKLDGGVDFDPGSGGGTLHLTQISGVWLETGRSAYTSGALVAAYGEIYVDGGATAQTGIGTTPVAINQFAANGVSLNTTPDHTGDDITVDVDGVYLIEAACSFTGSNNAEYTVQVYINGVAEPGIKFERKLGTGSDIGAASCMGIVSLSATDVVDLRVNTQGTSDSFTLKDGTLLVDKIS